jgi:hypothetical protein
MQQSANPSLGELKRETEQTRASLTQTVEQLRTSVSDTASDIRQRLSPESIKAPRSPTTFAPGASVWSRT